MRATFGWPTRSEGGYQDSDQGTCAWPVKWQGSPGHPSVTCLALCLVLPCMGLAGRY